MTQADKQHQNNDAPKHNLDIDQGREIETQNREKYVLTTL